MHTHISHNTLPLQSYGSANYNYSPTMYNTTSLQFNSSSVQAVSHVSPNNCSSPQDYQAFSVPQYNMDSCQFINNVRQQVMPSGSSTADSNGSIISEFDVNKNLMKKRRKPAPTIATGRRNLKNENVNSDEADRRDKRRERNRRSAQRCRERKLEKKDELERQIMDTNITCKKYLGLAESILKAWKQRLHLLNEKFPCNNYIPQLYVKDFENLIEVMHNRNKDTSETADSCGSVLDTSLETSNKHEYNLLPPQLSNTYITCDKIEPHYPIFNDVSGTTNPGFEQFHNCIPDSNIGYI